MYEKTKYIITGDQYVLIEFGNEISLDIHKKVRSLYLAINQHMGDKLVEIVPTYRSILIHYDPLIYDYKDIVDSIQKLELNLMDLELPEPKVFKIPVLYGGKYGPDLEYVAKHNSLTMEQVISIHSSTDYLIYMLGFTPGFCYLGGMSDKIATPRLKNPREVIPAGSVGIAGTQTGMYPIDSPGGWQLIGRTPVRLFDPHNEERPVLLQTGEYVRYYPVSEDEYYEIKRIVAMGEYKVEVI